jgi:hypothetical protein
MRVQVRLDATLDEVGIIYESRVSDKNTLCGIWRAFLRICAYFILPFEE